MNRMPFNYIILSVDRDSYRLTYCQSLTLSDLDKMAPSPNLFTSNIVWDIFIKFNGITLSKYFIRKYTYIHIAFSGFNQLNCHWINFFIF